MLIKAMAFDTETLVILFFILVALSSFGTGGWSTDTPLIWGPALFLSIPVQIFTAIATNAPILVPLALIAFFAYFGFLENAFGDPFVALVVVSGVIVMLGV